MSAKKQANKDTPHPIEHEAARAEHVARSKHRLVRQFYTIEGMVFVAAAIVFIAINNKYTRYFAWACLLAAFLVPMIKELLVKKG